MDLKRFTSDEAMQYLGCKATKFYSMVRRGVLNGTYFTIGKRHIFFKDKLDEWMLNGGEK